MNVNVVYLTKSGHSRKIAQAVADELGVPAQDLSLGEPELYGTDLLFIVSGIYGSKADPSLLTFIRGLSPDQVKRVAFITSSMSRSPQKEGQEALAGTGIPAAREEFTCVGSFLFFARKHPDEGELRDAARFARRLADDTAREGAERN